MRLDFYFDDQDLVIVVVEVVEVVVVVVVASCFSLLKFKTKFFCNTFH